MNGKEKKTTFIDFNYEKHVQCITYLEIIKYTGLGFYTKRRYDRGLGK